MQRRNFPSILLYSFGLALILSLAFNGFLLYEQSRHLSSYENELGASVHPVDQGVWQQLSDCRQANHRKDSRIGGSTDSSIRASAQYPAGSVDSGSEHPTKRISASAVR